MAKPKQYDGLSTSQLMNLLRERGIAKPKVSNVSELAAWLRDYDQTAAQQNTPAVKQDVLDPHVVSELAAIKQPAPDVDAMTNAELRAYAEQHGIDVSKAKSKADLLSAIQTESKG